MNYRSRNVFLASLAFLSNQTEAGFWRMNCQRILTGRVDPVVSPGVVSAHVHNAVGGYNFALNSSSKDMLASKCTSCELAADKSAYWTPQLYYQHANGSFEDVPNGGTIVYYLGRGDNLTNVQPFPPGFAMVSGSNAARAYDNTTKTWNGARPISDRVSWVCLDSSRTYPEVPGMLYTNCSYALRAQIQFQSCWDGVNPYKTDNSHVAYMSAIDNGACPPTHPVQLIHLFYEVYYAVSKIDQTNGGRFVLANGDATGYGFHGDFLNGWDNSVLTSALQQCAVGPVGSGQISDCPPLAAVDSAPGLNNCPERPPLVNETVKGMLNSLPGCNVVTSGPQPATPAQLYCGANVVPPTLNRFIMSTAADASVMPQVSSTVNGWQYLGSASDATNNRALSGSSWADDSMTVEVCQQYCTSKSFPLAGVEYGRECYCDTVLNPNSTLSASFSTIYNSMTCAGNGTEFCGGPSRLLLYKNLQFSPPYPARIGDTLGAAKYLGCANDSAQGRALAAKSKTSTNMTIATCSTFCSGYALFGVEYGSECYCDNKLAATSTLGQTGCKMVCGGNSTQICGGASMLGLFNNTGTAAVTPTTTPSTSPSATASPTGPSTPIANVSTAGSFTYVGCANENNANPGRALNGSNYANSTVTNDQCTAFCASQNFKYAGTEYGQECYCGNSLELGSSLNAAGCSSKCVGTLSPSSLFAQYSSVCGGGSLLSVWRNEKYKPVQVVPSVGNYASQGCYTDATSGRALTGGTYTNASMTVEMCVGYCSGNNFKFAGVEYAGECYCGNSLANTSVLASDQSTCNMVCKGNFSEWCGGPGRLNLYKR